VQLYIKAVYYELFGDLVRGHRLRELISILARSLDKHCFNELSSRLREFVKEFREALILSEEPARSTRCRELWLRLYDHLGGST
jgi:HEPN domain-containing protein